MAKQNLNYGSSPNDGTGDNLRNASIKIKSNFDELYARGLQEITDVNNETTNSIHINPISPDGSISIGVKFNDNYFGVDDFGEGYFNNQVKIDLNGDGSIIGEIHADNLTAPRYVQLPNFNCDLNGCTQTHNYTNDTTAAAGGIAIGQMYHTAGVVKIRLT